MRKRTVTLTLMLVAMLTLLGCKSESTKGMLKQKEYPVPQITIYADKKEADIKYAEYYYAVDEKTGVVYIVYENQHQYGMTPALNPDGTPMTKEQLTKEEEE